MPIVGMANDVEATNTDENINVSGDIYQNIAIKTEKNDKQISVIDNNTKYTDLTIDNVSDDDQSGGQNFQQSGAKRRNMKKQPKRSKPKKKAANMPHIARPIHGYGNKPSRQIVAQRDKQMLYGVQKFAQELADIFKKYTTYNTKSEEIQNDIVILLNKLQPVDDWLEIIKILLISCKIDCPEFLNPAMTRLSALNSFQVIKNGINERSRPITIAKLIIHHSRSLFASALINQQGYRYRKSTQNLLKNIFIEPTIFNSNECKNMFAWNLVIKMHEPNLSKYYRYIKTVK